MTKTSIRNCGDCIHCEMCKWIDDMVGDNTCDWFKEYREQSTSERPKGKWKVIGRNVPSNIFAYAWHVFCPKCNCDMFTEFTSYCPNCGEPKKKLNMRSDEE